MGTGIKEKELEVMQMQELTPINQITMEDWDQATRRYGKWGREVRFSFDAVKTFNDLSIFDLEKCNIEFDVKNREVVLRWEEGFGYESN